MADSDQTLMLRVQAGDSAPFAELVNRYRPRLQRFAESALHDRAGAEDVVQDTFLAIFQSRQTYNPAFAFSTWAWTILLNRVRRARHRAATRAAHQSQWAPVSATSSSSRGEDREQLDAWLSRIPEAEADALRLRFFGELTFEQIADSMESSLSGAKLRVRNGLERLSALAQEENRVPRSEGTP